MPSTPRDGPLEADEFEHRTSALDRTVVTGRLRVLSATTATIALARPVVGTEGDTRWDSSTGSRISDPVEGTYRLVACSSSSGGAMFENCSMDGVVSAPGIAPTAVHHVSLLTPTAKWPQPGQELPVMIERTAPDRLKIRWDRIPSTAETARLLAEQQAQHAAASMRAGTATPVRQAPERCSARRDARFPAPPVADSARRRALRLPPGTPQRSDSSR